MEFLNLGWMEIALILILAFIVLGPGKLVKTGRDLGSWIRKLSRDQLFREVVQTTDEIRRYPRKIFDESLLDLPPHVQQQKDQTIDPQKPSIIPMEESESEKPDPPVSTGSQIP
ncbi:MAG: twin-arginine translocase TatA/TatE family subunit [Anaerolineaceae bacterium]|nr:twin-arginine translocase TatA/TatE family subunit [Anaerolineaceae bacterium]